MKKLTLGTAAVALVCCSFLASAQDKETTVKGLITARAADSITVRTNDGVQVVNLTDDTKVQSPKGLFRKEEMSWTDLIPGLKVEVKGIPGGNDTLQARTVTFTKEDLQLASTIQAGLEATQKNVETNAENIATNEKGVAANKQGIAVNNDAIAANKSQIETNQKEVSERFNDLSDYEVKDKAIVYFQSGQSTISAADKAALSLLASNALQQTGYIIEVEGFADSSGAAAANQTLSRDRANAVIDYLMQDCKVPVRHIIAPGAMGISNPAASNESAQGRADNRRAVVKVLLNKGINSGSE